MDWIPNKLMGSIRPLQSGYCLCIDKMLNKRKTIILKQKYSSEEEALQARIEYNKQHGLSKNDYRYVDEAKTVVEMKLTKNQVMRFDATDLPIALKYTWRADSRKSGKYYASCGSLQFTHRILNQPQLHYVQHLSGDTLDNRRANLRVVQQPHRGGSRICLSATDSSSSSSGDTSRYTSLESLLRQIIVDQARQHEVVLAQINKLRRKLDKVSRRDNNNNNKKRQKVDHESAALQAVEQLVATTQSDCITPLATSNLHDT